jgi:oxygen-independent coproporphyrinogen-3 oxidase
MSLFGLYVHIPFCPQYCPYCAFAVLTGHQDLYERYAQAVCTELQAWQHLAAGKGPLHTLYFGGGTPSMLSPAQLRRLLETARDTLGIEPSAEITLEANPNTADAEKFAALRDLGFSRLSLGVQAFVDADLRALGRRHSAAEAERAYVAARQAGFANVSIDLMFSVPGAPRAHWQHTLAQVVALQPEHVSTYSLTIEEGTRFAQRYHAGRLQPVSEEDDAWAYAYTIETLAAAGYEHYEVSNFARPGYRSQHNWGYWHGAEYLGVGLAAHSYLDGKRRWNTRDVQQYIAHLEAGRLPGAGQEHLDATSAREEQIWLRLRTAAGAALSQHECRRLQEQPRFGGLLQDGFIALDGHTVRLTPQGFLLADAIGAEVVDMLDGAAL